MRKGLLRGWSKGLTLGAVLAVGSLPSVASAQATTLFKWGYGDGGEGLTAAEKLEEPLASDRPDFTEASSTVGLGVVQLESGYTYTYDSNDVSSTKSHSFPEALLRVGMLAEWFEFRIAQNYAEETNTDFGVSRTTETGAEDLYLGIKWGLTAQEGILPEMALITQMTVPSGDDAFTAGETLPGVVWLYGWDVNDWISTAGQTKGDRAIDDVTGDPFLEFSQSWTVGYSLAESLNAYTEWFVIAPDGADTNHTENYADGGFTYLVTNNLQLDIRAGVGLNEAADDYFVGSGFVIRR
jgi:hypothetical protein